MSEYVRKSLGINNIKTAVLGAVLIDTNVSTGLQTKNNMMSSPRHDNHSITTPIKALQVYPEVVGNESTIQDNKVLSMGALWFNGFIPHSRGIAEPENCTHSTANIMSKYGIVTTDQVIKSRPDEWIDTLFSCLKWYGGDSSHTISSPELQLDTAIGKVVRKGLIHPTWLNNPLSVRYMIRELSNDDNGKDFVFLIGGSDFLLQDTSSEICQSICDKMNTIKCMDIDKNPPKEITLNSQINDSIFTWHEIDINSYSESFKNSTYVKAKLLNREISRAIQGIIMIRNSIVYARKCLGITSLIDVNLNKSGDPIKVSIDEVIERYDGAYKFVRNLICCDPSIGDGHIF
jgi:hypothetical protein